MRELGIVSKEKGFRTKERTREEEPVDEMTLS